MLMSVSRVNFDNLNRKNLNLLFFFEFFIGIFANFGQAEKGECQKIENSDEMMNPIFEYIEYRKNNKIVIKSNKVTQSRD
jgi:hypothetical protein